MPLFSSSSHPEKKFLLAFAEKLVQLRREINTIYQQQPSEILSCIAKLSADYLVDKTLNEYDHLKLLKYYFGPPATSKKHITLKGLLTRKHDIPYDIFTHLEASLIKLFDEVLLHYVATLHDISCYIPMPMDRTVIASPSPISSSTSVSASPISANKPLPGLADSTIVGAGAGDASAALIFSPATSKASGELAMAPVI